MAPALRMPARGSSMMSFPATLRRERACGIGLSVTHNPQTGVMMPVHVHGAIQD